VQKHRLNPQCSTQGDHALYDPCAPGSRFGVTIDKIPSDLLELVDGLHFHTLCEQGADDLETTLKAVEEQFGSYLHQCLRNCLSELKTMWSVISSNSSRSESLKAGAKTWTSPGNSSLANLAS